MSEESRMPLPRPSGRSRSQGLFNTAMGPLQRQLRMGEYNLLKCSPMFESEFVQISKKGGAVDVHNQVQLVRVAIAATSPTLRIPNVLLLARPVRPSRERRLAPHTRIRHSPRMIFELTRLLPLCFVKISVHDREKQQLRFKLVSGRTFYLQLCPQQDGRDDIFESWVKIIHLLRPPSKPKHKLLEPDREPAQEQEAPQQPKDRSVEPFGLVDKEKPEAESTLQEETKEKEDPAAKSSQEPSQEQQNVQEDTSSSTSPPSQDETTEEEKAPLPEDQDPQEQLKKMSGDLERRPKTRPPTSRY
ncbi:Golgi-associated RAB2 interactor protein 6-like [Heteronotia binoei]|uniref:Golgi-associated RAB2 interactor protein 6-like n=1 Tax=Heteronotia binoei TaxID=13085 RepID=UPI00292CF7E7|nr:Golgi-associated RAB2 interactor protein 6-like [Heteronotia binoei]